MCLIEIQEYIHPDGRRETKETQRRCHNAVGSSLCSYVETQRKGPTRILEVRPSHPSSVPREEIIVTGGNGKDRRYREVRRAAAEAENTPMIPQTAPPRHDRYSKDVMTDGSRQRASSMQPSKSTKINDQRQPNADEVSLSESSQADKASDHADKTNIAPASIRTRLPPARYIGTDLDDSAVGGLSNAALLAKSETIQSGHGKERQDLQSRITLKGNQADERTRGRIGDEYQKSQAELDESHAREVANEAGQFALADMESLASGLNGALFSQTAMTDSLDGSDKHDEDRLGMGKACTVDQQRGDLETDIRTLLNSDLKEICKAYNYQVYGTKAVLEKRCIKILHDIVARGDPEALTDLRYRLKHHGRSPLRSHTAAGANTNDSSQDVINTYWQAQVENVSLDECDIQQAQQVETHTIKNPDGDRASDPANVPYEGAGGPKMFTSAHNDGTKPSDAQLVTDSFGGKPHFFVDALSRHGPNVRSLSALKQNAQNATTKLKEFQDEYAALEKDMTALSDELRASQDLKSTTQSSVSSSAAATTGSGANSGHLHDENEQKLYGYSFDSQTIDHDPPLLELADEPASPKRHKCPYCTSEFKRQHDLEIHLLAHVPETSCVCKTCQMRFRDEYDLRRHTKLHTAELRLVCDVCGRQYKRIDALIRHRLQLNGCVGRRANLAGDGNQIFDDEGLLVQRSKDHSGTPERITDDLRSASAAAGGVADRRPLFMLAESSDDEATAGMHNISSKRSTKPRQQEDDMAGSSPGEADVGNLGTSSDLVDGEDSDDDSLEPGVGEVIDASSQKATIVRRLSQPRDIDASGDFVESEHDGRHLHRVDAVELGPYLKENIQGPQPDMLKPPIKFKDSVGRKFNFPWHLCRTWKGMEQLIKQAFLHVDVIRDHVHQGHYDLTRSTDGEIILPQVWESVILPGCEITMHLWPMEEEIPTEQASARGASDPDQVLRIERKTLPRDTRPEDPEQARLRRDVVDESGDHHENDSQLPEIMDRIQELETEVPYGVSQQSMPDWTDDGELGRKQLQGFFFGSQEDSSRSTTETHHHRIDDSPVDESETESTYAESIFSAVSIASSLSSVSNELSGTLVRDLVSFLFCNSEISEVNTAAIQDIDIGADRFRRNARRLVARYGKNLKPESNGQGERGAARILQSRFISTRAAQEILDQTRRLGEDSTKALPSTNSAQVPARRYNLNEDSDASDVESDDEDTAEPDLLEKNFQVIKSFLLESQAYTAFKSELLQFTHKPYEGRIAKAFGASALSQTGNSMNALALRSLAAELSWVPIRYISVSSKDDVTASDHAKGWVESQMGETWNWWPLRQRRKPIGAGNMRVKWITPCRSIRYIDLPIVAAEKLQEVLKTAPAFLNNTTLCKTMACASAAPGGSGSQNLPSRSVPAACHINGSNFNNPTRPPPAPPCNALNSNNSVQAQMQANDERHIYFGIETGKPRHIVDLSVHTMQSDQDFFLELKMQYFKARSWLRRCFSMWQYDHCDFVKYQKTAISPGDPGKISFPPCSDPRYDFAPKPLDSEPPEGPITEAEFHDWFYKTNQTRTVWNPLHIWTTPKPTSVLPCHKWSQHQPLRMNIAPITTNEAIAVLPKLKEAISLYDGKREAYWGLHARERRNFARVLAYLFLCNVPGILFFFLWLFWWGHASDLQNASVPIQLSLSLTICFVAFLYETRDGKKES